MRGALALLLLLAGCASGPELRVGVESERLCAAPEGRAAFLPPLSPPAAVQAAAARMDVPVLAAQMADTLGILPQLEALRAPPRRSMAEEMVRLRLRQTVQARLMQGMLEAAGTMAALDCEGERGDQLRGLLQAREDRRNRRLSIASIALGAATATVTGGLSIAGAATAADIAAIAGGVGEATAGAGLLVVREEAELTHRRNLLAEVVRPDGATQLPPLVRRHLMRERPDGPPLAARILAQWEGGPLAEEEGGARRALILGEGGRYGVAELSARDAMLDLLEAQVALMNRELQLLLAALPD